MNEKLKNILYILILGVVFIKNSYSQEVPLNYEISLLSNLSTTSNLPFWMSSNNKGSYPNTSNGIVNVMFFKSKNRLNNSLYFSYKSNITSYLAKNQQHILINEFYGSLLYRNLCLDIGSKNPNLLFEGLSSSNGNITYSNNARAFPGYNFYLTDYITLPFAKKWLSFKGNYGDFLLNDKRIVNNARLHKKSIFFKSKLGFQTSLILGLNHYVQWAGTSSSFGKQPSGFKDYLRVITGKSGGRNAYEGDQINVLGNHLGSYLVQFNYDGRKTKWNIYWSHPFEDRSGRELMNYPDALYGFFIDFKKSQAWITHLLVEFTNTTNMSHNLKYPGSINDNYFNNGVYQSGWTYFGNTIGSPYFIVSPVNENGITQGVFVGDNRFRAFNIGLKGTYNSLQYKLLFSHVTYFGWFGNEYSSKPQQWSGLLEINLPIFYRNPFNLTLGTAFDSGTYTNNIFGGYIKITKKGIF